MSNTKAVALKKHNFGDDTKVGYLLLIKPEKVLEIIATKQAHIEKCRKRLKHEAKP